MKTVVKITNRFFGLLLLTSMLFACSAEDGEDGAVGPAGPQGAQGVAGPQGEQGEQGEPGTANVIYSDWIPTEFPANITSPIASFELSAPEVTDEIISSGLILVYGLSFGGSVYGLPVSFNDVGFNETHFYRIDIAGEISIRINSLDGADIGSRLFSSYRYIIIPGGVAAGSKSAALDYQKMSYEEITSHFNIPM